MTGRELPPPDPAPRRRATRIRHAFSHPFNVHPQTAPSPTPEASPERAATDEPAPEQAPGQPQGQGQELGQDLGQAPRTRLYRTLIGVLTAALLTTGTALTWVLLPLNRQPAPTPTPTVPDAYPAMATRDGLDAHWGRCDLTYALNLRHAPAGARADVRAALGQLSDLTGLRFTAAADTTVIPQAEPPGRARAKTADLVIAWAPAQISTLLRDGEAGHTTLTTRYTHATKTSPARHVIIAAAIAIDTRPANTGGRTGHASYLLHELAHAVGVGHNPNPRSLLAHTIARHRPTPATAADRDAIAATGRHCT